MCKRETPSHRAGTLNLPAYAVATDPEGNTLTSFVRILYLRFFTFPRIIASDRT